MSIRLILRSLTVLAVLASAQAATAQTAQTPSQVLSGLPNGGPEMVAQVQSLMNADRGNLVAILTFAKSATQDQRKAIGEGLALTAKNLAANDPGYATQIQQQVAASGIPELAKSYAEAAGDTGTAAAGGGGGGGGGPTAGGPPTGGANNGVAPAGGRFVANTSTFLTGGGVSGGGFSSVSPTR